jgi:choline dehydrogenase-like flavoprotein
MLTRYDYVIVGAGAAGCAVANRLSADPGTTVLLLEAGGRDWSPLVHMPVGFTKLSGPRYNWGFSTVPQRELNNRKMWYPQGRTLGGGTSINAMIYIRGQKEDYEAWAAMGNKHWGYEQVLPFFRRAEANERLNDRFHGTAGAQPAEQGVRPRSSGTGRPVHGRFQRRCSGWRGLVRRDAEERRPGQCRVGLPPPGTKATEPDYPDSRTGAEDRDRERPRRRV